MKPRLGGLAQRASSAFVSSRRWRRFLYKATVNALESEQGRYHDEWKLIDPVFSSVRARLSDSPQWRYGPAYAYDGARWVFDRLSSYADVRGAVFCDLGCGKHSPLGTSALLYLNGADECIATDILEPLDPARAARALYDLLTDCLALPAKWQWTENSDPEFYDRVHRFDLDKLRDGDLEGGLGDAPVRRITADISADALFQDKVSLMTSRSVLEHIPQLEKAAANMYTMLRPGGLMFHFVDLADHAIYGPPSDKHYWSFLEETQWHGHTNRLRAHEVLSILQAAGFEVLDTETETCQLPPGLRERLDDRFAQMTDAQLETIRIGVALRKP